MPLTTFRQNMRFCLRSAHKALWLLLAATLGACELWDESVGGFESPRLFTRANYSSAAECAIAQAEGWNCTSELRLCPNGGGWVSLGSDILDQIEYAAIGDRIFVKSEFYRLSLVFTRAGDDALLANGNPRARWERDREQEERLGSTGCH